MTPRIAFPFLAGFLALATTPVHAAQEEDAKTLAELFHLPKPTSEWSGYDAKVDGCSAEVNDGWYYYRFLLTSIDYEATEGTKDLGSLYLNEDARRMWMMWHYMAPGTKEPMPRAPKLDGISYDDMVRVESRGLPPNSPEVLRLRKEARAKWERTVEEFRRAAWDYYEKLQNGAFGPWFQQHYRIDFDGGFPGAFEPMLALPLGYRIPPNRAKKIIAAIKAYTAKYCPDPPDFTCTKYFVNPTGTKC